MIRRGVSFYSYQQSQFFKELGLEEQIAELAEIDGADGIELIDEMSLHYPNPGTAFIDRWFGLMDAHGTQPVALDVGMDVLQFRDHVMTHEECAERLRADIRLARMLGFPVVRVLSTTPVEVMVAALDEAERQDVRLGKEVHQPMRLEGPTVSEVLETAERLGTDRLGIVPDMGIFQYRPSEASLKWFGRKGAKDEALDGAVRLSEMIRAGQTGGTFDVSTHTAGNIRSDFRRFLTSGEAPEAVRPAFEAIAGFTRDHVPAPREVDYLVVAEALTFSATSPETLRQMAGKVVCVHGKFYEMSQMEGVPGAFTDLSIDYDAGIAALKAGGYDGYVNSEYEGQRYYQDRTRAELMSEVDQVRKHQSMLARLLA